MSSASGWIDSPTRAAVCVTRSRFCASLSMLMPYDISRSCPHRAAARLSGQTLAVGLGAAGRTLQRRQRTRCSFTALTRSATSSASWVARSPPAAALARASWRHPAEEGEVETGGHENTEFKIWLKTYLMQRACITPSRHMRFPFTAVTFFCTDRSSCRRAARARAAPSAIKRVALDRRLTPNYQKYRSC